MYTGMGAAAALRPKAERLHLVARAEAAYSTRDEPEMGHGVGWGEIGLGLGLEAGTGSARRVPTEATAQRAPQLRSNRHAEIPSHFTSARRTRCAALRTPAAIGFRREACRHWLQRIDPDLGLALCVGLRPLPTHRWLRSVRRIEMKPRRSSDCTQSTHAVWPNCVSRSHRVSTFLCFTPSRLVVS